MIKDPNLNIDGANLREIAKASFYECTNNEWDACPRLNNEH